MSKFSSIELTIISNGPHFVFAATPSKEDVRGNVLESGETFFAHLSDRRVPDVAVDGSVTWRLPEKTEVKIPSMGSTIEVVGKIIDPTKSGGYRRIGKWALANDCACAEKLQGIMLTDFAAKAAEEKKRIEENRRQTALLIAANETASALRYTEKRPGFHIPGTVTDIVAGYFFIKTANDRIYVAPRSNYCFPWVRSTKSGPIVRFETTPKPGTSLAPKVGDGVIIITSSWNADPRHNLFLAFGVVDAEAFGKAGAEQLKAASTLAIKASQCEQQEKERQSAVVAAQRPAKAGRNKQKQRV